MQTIASRHAFDVLALDALLGGGVETGAVTAMYGEAGSGKTNLCLALAAAHARGGGRTVFVDTEGLSPERLYQVAAGSGADLGRLLLVQRADSMREQEKAVARAAKLAKKQRVGLVIVDSATLHYRLALSDAGSADGVAQRALARHLHALSVAAHEAGFAALVTSQVYDGLDGGPVRMLGGHAARHLLKAVVRVERADDGARRMILERHRSLPEGGVAEFRITGQGVA